MRERAVQPKQPATHQKDKTMWTQFKDMHSGGSQKLAHEYIYIEAPESEAIRVFYNRFHRNPHRVTCTCCGNDYAIDEGKTLEEVTGFERGCEYRYVLEDGRSLSNADWIALPIKERAAISKFGRYVDQPSTERWNPYCPLDEYLQRPNVLVIRADEIDPQERVGEVPDEGFVWAGG